MAKRIDRTGMKFGKLTITDEYRINKRTMAVCQCECGNTKDNIRVSSLTSGNTMSCGCEHYGKYKIKNKALYQSWWAMVDRCNNPKSQPYKNYGGRGVKVCERWLDYDNFAEDMVDGHEKGLTIERVNVDGNYEKDNCCWVTQAQQCQNWRHSVKITYKGETKPYGTFAREYGLIRSTVKSRLDLGWSIHDALNTPVKTQYRSK